MRSKFARWTSSRASSRSHERSHAVTASGPERAQRGPAATLAAAAQLPPAPRARGPFQAAPDAVLPACFRCRGFREHKKRNPGCGSQGFLFLSSCRGGQIRTADLSDPNRTRYQAALRPELATPRLRGAGRWSFPSSLSSESTHVRDALAWGGRGWGEVGARGRDRPYAAPFLRLISPTRAGTAWKRSATSP